VKDHVIPLACGGAGSPANMQRETVANYWRLFVFTVSDQPAPDPNSQISRIKTD
jgi:hypothetical protein